MSYVPLPPPRIPPPRGLIGNQKHVVPSKDTIKTVTSFSSVVYFLSGIILGTTLSLIVISILQN